MSQLDVCERPKNHNPVYSEPTTMAERELTAYFNAVKELFGSEQARLSAEDWLDKLAAMKNLPATIREWRELTVNVSAGLASRVTPYQTASRTLTDSAGKAI
jgi:hypothetical protein